MHVVSSAAAQPAPANPPAQAAPNDASAQDSGEIVVTGSRIRRQDFSSATPIHTLGADALTESGAGTVSDALNQLPQIAPPNPGVASAAGRAARSPIDLRGLGATRALVLLDGRRVQPSSGDGTVDVNFLPSGLVRQVETITGGASSVYGSDAVTGVVNFILRRDIDGFELRGQYNQPEFGAGESYNLGLVGGSEFAGGRGHALFALDYTDRERALRPERDYWAFSQSSAILDRPVFNFASNSPTQDAINDVFGAYGATAGSVARNGRLAVNEDGTLFTQAPVGTSVVNYRGPLDDRNVILGNSVLRNNGLTYDVIVPIQRSAVFGRVDYDVTDTTNIFAQLFFSRNDVSSQSTDTGPGTNGTNAFLPTTNPFIPDDLRTLLNSRATPGGTVPFQLMLTQLGASTVNSQYDVLQFVTGASGKMFGDWNWDVYATYGQSEGEARQIGMSSLSAIQELLNAPDGGVSLCDGGFNVFGPTNSFSASCLDYIRRETTSTESLDQTVVEGTIEGPLFSLPAGTARLAAGVSYRDNSYETNPDPGLGTGDLIGSMAAFAASGSQDVSEIFGELYVPLLGDLPLVDELSLDVGYRYSDYSNFGGADTYKADIIWSLTDWFMVRGGYARAIRAPSLSELYSATSALSATIGSPTPGGFTGDPCDVRTGFRTGPNAAQVRALCIAQGVPEEGVDGYTYATSTIFGSTGGNSDLDPEIGDTYTLGVVAHSPFDNPLLANLSVSVDHYDIEITGAIGQLPITTTLARCFNADGSNPTYDVDNFYCQFIGRNSVGSLAGNTRVPTLNLGSYRTQGFDIQADWRADIEDFGLNAPGGVSLTYVGSYVEEFLIQPLNGTTPLDYSGHTQGGITNAVMPKWKFVANAGYELGAARVGVRWRYIGEVDDVSRVTSPASTTPGVDAQNYFDLNGSYDLSERLRLYGGVNNIADRDPPQVGATVGFATDQATYDVMGRLFYLGFSAKF